MHSILDQRESRLSLEIAVQQQRLGYSMKTLALLGAFFLPGTFLSSVFGMSFFDFSPGRYSSHPAPMKREVNCDF